jgi:hypothetical protein
MIITVDLRSWDKLKKELEREVPKAVKYAVRDALNAAAFETRREWSKEIESRFTTRNKYTGRAALRVERAIGIDVRSMQSSVGSIADYMAKQEFGGATKGPIPGPVAAGQAPGAKRTKPVRATNRIRTLQAARVRGGSRKQRNAAAMAMAKRKGQKHAVLDRPGGGQGLFRITGSKRKLSTRLVWAVGRGSSRVPATPTLQPVLRRLMPTYERLAEQAFLKQLKRHRVLGY